MKTPDSKLAEATPRRLINTHDQLKAAHAAGRDQRSCVAIGYAVNGGRSVLPAWWKVWSPFFETNPDSAWYEYGGKTFTMGTGETHKERKAAALKTAQEWAVQFGVIEWAKNRAGNYVPAEVQKRFPLPKRP